MDALAVRVAARFLALTPHQKGWEHRKEKDEAVLRELEPHLQHLWKKMQYQFKGTPHERAEKFKEYLEEHPGDEMGALQDDVDRELDRMIRKHELAMDEVPFSASMRTASSLWYHLTDRAKFKLDPKFKPADNSVAIVDRSGRPGIYLGQSVEKWVNGYNYWRPFVVEFRVDPSVVNDPGVHGRYGGEMFVPATSFDKLTIVRVIPLDAYAREEYGEPGWIESSLGHAFDTGEPIDHKTRFPGYRYPGPDVRSMPSGDAMRLKKDLRRVKH